MTCCIHAYLLIARFFRRATGNTFTDFVNHVRISRACQLLMETNLQISAIAYQVGFNNLANFNRLFKKYRSCTPIDYRKRYLEKNDFDWTKQVTPWQFLPQKADGMEVVQPAAYSTKLMHV